MKTRLFIFSLFIMCMTGVAGREVYSLQQCIVNGVRNNLSLETRRNEMEETEYGISENRARLLPQINAFAGFSDNFVPPVSVTDGSAYGNPYNVTKTLQYSANAGLKLQMPLYDRTLYTAVNVARIMNEISAMSYEKAREDLMMEIARVYYLGQTTAEQIRLVEGNIRRLEELRNITDAFHDNGMAMEVDVKRVDINLESMRIQLDNAKAMYAQQINILKYIMDFPADMDMELTPLDADDMAPVVADGMSEELAELRIMDARTTLAEQQSRMVKQGYLPSLSLTGNLSFSAFTDKGYHLFHDHVSNRWYDSSGLALSLRIPVFDGLEKRYKRKKAEINVSNMKLEREDMYRKLQTQYINATMDLMNSRRNYRKQKENCVLAEEVYEVTSERYKEGVASMTEVLQDEMRMSEAQNSYVNAHYNYRITNLTLMKLSGKLGRLMSI